MPLSVPPSPKKCLAVAKTFSLPRNESPSPCKPIIRCLPNSATNFGSSE